MERGNEKANAPRSSRNSASRKKKGEKKESERTRGEQRAGKQAGQSLAHPTKKLTPEKLTHQRATKDERETKQRCVVLASLRPSFPPPPLPLAPGHSITFRKQKTREKPSEKNKLLSAKNETSFDGREGTGRGTRCRGQGRPGKGQRESTKSHQETDSSKLIVSDNSRWHTKKDCTKEISGSSFEKRETTRSGREKKKEREGGGNRYEKGDGKR